MSDSRQRLLAKPQGPNFGQEPVQFVFTGEFAPFAGSQVLDKKAPFAANDHHPQQEAALSHRAGAGDHGATLLGRRHRSVNAGLARGPDKPRR